MDLILDILLLKNDMNKLNMSEILVEWCGEFFSQEPKKYNYKSSLFFQQHENKAYYRKIIGDKLKNYEYTVLTLEGDSLTNLEFMVNNNRDTINNNNELITFFHDLYQLLDIFCIILLLDEEHIDNKYIITNADDAVNIFLDSLNWKSPKGIVISKL